MGVFFTRNGMATSRLSVLPSTVIRHRIVNPKAAEQLTVAKERIFNATAEVRV